MNNLCRRCPSPDPFVGDGTCPAERTSLLPSRGETLDKGFRVVVLAGSPALLPTEPGEPATELDWQDAVVALAAAVVERGGTLVAPANVGLVSLLAEVAVPHAQPHAAEGLLSGAPVEAVETGGRSMASRRLLAPYAHRNCLTLLTRDRDPVPLEEMPTPTETDGEFLLDAEHHPFDRLLMNNALGAVVIHPDLRMNEEMFDLQGMDLPRLAVVGGANVPETMAVWARQHDPVPDLLRDEPDLDTLVGQVPYALIMELLIDNWLDRIPT